MNGIYITGATGFIGSSMLRKKWANNINISNKNESINIGFERVVVHLAGKAHDLKKTTSPKEYYQVNSELTNRVFNAFINSIKILFYSIISKSLNILINHFQKVF
jgi:nucleoside-diphosphate-sugar epimerase